jgi:hypothetical protein
LEEEDDDDGAWFDDEDDDYSDTKQESIMSVESFKSIVKLQNEFEYFRQTIQEMKNK